MKETPAIYNGRVISKKHFRAFIYSPDGKQKLVESWEEFEEHMSTGLWFASKVEANSSVIVVNEKPKAKTKAKAKSEIKEEFVNSDEDQEQIEMVIKDDLAFEVKDDFLPK